MEALICKAHYYKKIILRKIYLAKYIIFCFLFEIKDMVRAKLLDMK
jgi:hypothetical protein